MPRRSNVRNGIVKDMSYKRDDPNVKAICQAAHKRVVAVLRCLAVLAPEATPRQRKRLANRILSLADGKDRSVKINEAALQEIVKQNSQCISKQCPLLFFWEPMSRQLNAYFSEEE